MGHTCLANGSYERHFGEEKWLSKMEEEAEAEAEVEAEEMKKRIFNNVWSEFQT